MELRPVLNLATLYGQIFVGLGLSSQWHVFCPCSNTLHFFFIRDIVAKRWQMVLRLALGILWLK